MVWPPEFSLEERMFGWFACRQVAAFTSPRRVDLNDEPFPSSKRYLNLIQNFPMSAAERKKRWKRIAETIAGSEEVQHVRVVGTGFRSDLLDALASCPNLVSVQFTKWGRTLDLHEAHRLRQVFAVSIGGFPGISMKPSVFMGLADLSVLRLQPTGQRMSLEGSGALTASQLTVRGGQWKPVMLDAVHDLCANESIGFLDLRSTVTEEDWPPGHGLPVMPSLETLIAPDWFWAQENAAYYAALCRKVRWDGTQLGSDFEGYRKRMMQEG